MRDLTRVLAHPAVGAVCRVVLGGIFIYTGLPKLTHPAEFARFVHGYHVLHPSLVNLVGITLPWIEVTAGGFLVIGVLPRSSAAVIAGLLGVFIGAGFLALVRARDQVWMLLSPHGRTPTHLDAVGQRRNNVRGRASADSLAEQLHPQARGEHAIASLSGGMDTEWCGANRKDT